MKKLMITAAAAMTAMVGFCTIESSNVVGYDTTSLLSGGQAKGVGASFVNVSGTDLTLGDLKIVGYDPEEGYADFAITAQGLDGAGRTLFSYSYCDFEEDGETYVGWYDDDMNCYNDMVILPGEGLWIYSPSTDFKVQSAGMVPASDIAVTLRSGGQAKRVVNPMAAPVSCGNIRIAGYDPEEGYADFAITAQGLDGAGRTISSYSYCDFEEDGETYLGWYDDDMNDYNELSLLPGEGLWIYSPSSEFSVVFPTPLVK